MERIRKGDLVVVMAGKERQKEIKARTGKVLRVLPERQRALVEGLNLVKKHQRPRRQGEQGGIITQPASIALANLMLLCPKCNRPTRIGYTRLNDETKVRVCRKCTEPVSAA